MSKPLPTFLDDFITPVFAQRDPALAPWFFDYFAELATPTGRKRFARALAADLSLAGFDPAGKTVLDAGSGFGMTLFALAHLGAAEAIGVERFTPMIDSAIRLHADHLSHQPVRFLQGSVDGMPLAPASVDFIYCNEALSHFLNPPGFLDEASRVLRPGGRIMVCDGNNALNPGTVAEVHEVWRRFEEGPPGENIHGHRVERPYRLRRGEMIAAALPDLTPEVVEKLAWGTYALHGPAVVRRAREILDSGTLPADPPAVDRCPVDPDKGDHIENLIDPHQLAADLQRRGFSTRVHAHFGGARSPWVAAANRVLRAMTPLTITRARSVKVVGTRLANRT